MKRTDITPTRIHLAQNPSSRRKTAKKQNSIFLLEKAKKERKEAQARLSKEKSICFSYSRHDDHGKKTTLFPADSSPPDSRSTLLTTQGLCRSPFPSTMQDAAPGVHTGILCWARGDRNKQVLSNKPSGMSLWCTLQSFELQQNN